MFISEKFVYIALQKTGSNHIRQVLATLFEGEIVGKHRRATPDLLKSGRTFIGSIRNPWEWYISLWAFGCDKEGRVYGQIMKSLANSPRPNPESPSSDDPSALPQGRNSLGDKWKQCYSDVHNRSHFRDWLYLMHESVFGDDIVGGYGPSSVSQVCGLMTFRYMQLFCKNLAKPDFKTINSFDALKAREKGDCYINYFVHTEHLSQELIHALESSGVVLTKKEKDLINATPPQNTSSRTKNANYYYDKETIELVYERERLIVDKFDYLPPSVS